jgi:RNA polymerase subunit RPABC4/transcription elongation factor Spt4
MPAKYFCSNCGRRVEKNKQVCPHCHVRLVGVHCTHCGFNGSRIDFPGDRCPKCGSVVHLAGDESVEVCKKCGRAIAGPYLTCPYCGYSKLGMIIGIGTISMACIVGGVIGFINCPSIVWVKLVVLLMGFYGTIGLIYSISEIINGLKAPRRH